MGRDVSIDVDTSMDLLEETIKSFKDKALVKYDEESNQILLNICKQDIGQYHKDVLDDMKYLKKIILLNKAIKILPNQSNPDLDNAYKTGAQVMNFECEQFTRLKHQLKKGNPKISDGAYYYCVYLGLIKSHINTNGYIADAKEKIVSNDSFYGYVPSDQYKLSTPEFQQTIIDALDDLCEEKENHKCK